MMLVISLQKCPSICSILRVLCSSCYSVTRVAVVNLGKFEAKLSHQKKKRNEIYFMLFCDDHLDKNVWVRVSVRKQREVSRLSLGYAKYNPRLTPG